VKKLGEREREGDEGNHSGRGRIGKGGEKYKKGSLGKPLKSQGGKIKKTDAI